MPGLFAAMAASSRAGKICSAKLRCAKKSATPTAATNSEAMPISRTSFAPPVSSPITSRQARNGSPQFTAASEKLWSEAAGSDEARMDSPAIRAKPVMSASASGAAPSAEPMRARASAQVASRSKAGTISAAMATRRSEIQGRP